MKAISFARISVGATIYLMIVSVFKVAESNALIGLAILIGILILFEKILEYKNN